MLGLRRGYASPGTDRFGGVRRDRGSGQEMHGIIGFIIIGACVCAAVLAAVLFIRDVRSSQRAAEKRRRLASRLLGK